jgi:CelD/BcsL family acetyltransferase involved in cellulose biosynthesis
MCSSENLHNDDKYQVQIIYNYQDFCELRSAWEDLYGRSVNRTIFQTFDWCKIWLETYTDINVDQLFIIIIKSLGEIKLIAPMRISQKKIFCFKFRYLSIISSENYAADFCNFIYEEDNIEVFDKLIDVFEKNAYRWDCIHLHNLPENLKWINSFKEYRSNKYSVSCDYLYGAPYLEYISAQDLSKYTNKKYFNKLSNKLKTKGQCSLSIPDSNIKKHDYLENLFEIHNQQWIKKPQFINKLNRDFFINLLENITNKPDYGVEISALQIDSQLIAIHFGFHWDKTFLWYKPTYREDYAEFSAGHLLLIEQLKEKFNNFEVFDLGCGSESYKSRFSNMEKALYLIEFERSKLLKFIRILKNFRNFGRKLLKQKQLAE